MARRLALICWLLATLGAHADQWLPVRETALELSPGSPLDFSTLLPNPQLDADHRLVVANGRLAMSDQPDQPVPLLCASLGWSPASGGFPSHAEADRYARQLAMHGYNIARLHNVDASLMVVAQRDFDFDPETLDRFHYLLAALKREGISWIFDGLTSNRGGFGGHDDRWDNFGSLKQEVLLGADGFAHWLELQRRILGATNPYTGIAPIADPALAIIVLVNEGALEFDSLLAQERGGVPYSARIAEGFNLWLRRHYADTAALAAAWGGLDPLESLEAGTIALPSERYQASPGYRDLQRYFVAVETAGTTAMTAALREMGYQGAVTNYNNWPTLQTSLSRRDLDV
ncbi:MAG TPA: glycoside hydrolase, partial [Devosia sp.]|nr:glycoside hydrolase [Devosia sp.]